MIKEVMDKKYRMNIAKEVLLDLPEWFGMDEYTKMYIANSAELPFFAIYDNKSLVGFISLKETSKHTIEIYCMGVLKRYHNKGFGKKLFYAAKFYAIKMNYKFMQVKTVKHGTYDIYDKTNAFYKSVGFLEFEVFPKLWDEWNPCQVFVLAL